MFQGLYYREGTLARNGLILKHFYFVDQTPIPEMFNDPGPNIITKLTPGIQRLEIGAATEWFCQGFGENPNYGWEKDFKVVSLRLFK